MQRYFISAEEQWDFNRQKILLNGNDYHHIVNVMRMQSSDQVICCHPSRHSYLAQIIDIDELGKQVECKIVSELDEQSELPIDVTIAHGLPKGDKLDLIVQKSTELGMRELIPLKMDRSIVKWDAKKESKKVERLRKIAKEASEQSHRQSIPQITSSKSIKDVLEESTFDEVIVASEYEAKVDKKHHSTFIDVLSNLKLGARLLVIVGPEGGISDEEIEIFNQYECKPIRLGPRILRSETAPLYILSAISFYFEEWR
ncbi:16S rRNA (uracil(1498)-N(3))-methyltransferase [Alkalibacillus aidingensis]|uniref:16S rRNA (uracil(1498)-N(3))-methyltransferase n=1 Tax=Alkalibacillus aidingensis TaxID=2747607 RepID=UPI0016603E45|nr:16S rRNA (uracil(1498)-N(3))-methyltransferase [Alkalibacillus aidingensis]